MNKILIIGLGNPGERYLFTRHNIGYMFLDRLAGKYKKSRNGSFMYAVEKDFIALKPQTFMNRSGVAVKEALNRFKQEIDDILVVCDDFNLPLGKIRIRPAGSSGGHNGLQSVIDILGTNSFSRLRMGIGGIEELDKSKYVLNNFNKKELKIIDEILFDAGSILDSYINSGIDITMSRFN